MNYSSFEKSNDNFEVSVSKLSSVVGHCGSLWKDEKYSALTETMGYIAIQLREILVSAEQCIKDFEQFNNIYNEPIE